MPRRPSPTSLVFPPLRDEHTQTIIALHGKGSHGERFGHELLLSANLRSRLPTVKLVFPTASKRRATMYKRILINQWFDNYSLDDPNQRADLQIQGLCESAEYIRGLITEEARILGKSGHRKVILRGLSQGCAAGIFTLLGGWPELGKTEAIGAFVGMSGWLPFERHLQETFQYDSSSAMAEQKSYALRSDSRSTEVDVMLSGEEGEGAELFHLKSEVCPFQQRNQSYGDFDTFLREEEEAPKGFLPVQAIDYVWDILDFPMYSTEGKSPMPLNLCQLQTPVFIGHGAEDPKVSLHLGKSMFQILSNGLGMDVTWRSYEALGHWYRVADGILDVMKFLEFHTVLRVEDEPPASSDYYRCP